MLVNIPWTYRCRDKVKVIHAKCDKLRFLHGKGDILGALQYWPL